MSPRFFLHGLDALLTSPFLRRIVPNQEPELVANNVRVDGKMKKALGSAVCALGIFVAAGNAEAARHRFWGGLVVTAASAICAGEVNQKFAVRFRPAGLGDGTSSTITLFRHDSARHFQVNGLFNSTLKTATSTDVFDYVSPADIPASIKFSAQFARQHHNHNSQYCRDWSDPRLGQPTNMYSDI